MKNKKVLNENHWNVIGWEDFLGWPEGQRFYVVMKRSGQMEGPWAVFTDAENAKAWAREPGMWLENGVKEGGQIQRFAMQEALQPDHQAILEAIKGMLSQDAKLGLASHEEDKSNPAQYKWESMREAFALKIADSAFFESLTAAFSKVHAWKYVCDSSFKPAFEFELKSMGIPYTVTEKALKAIDSIVEDLSESNQGEQASGWHPNIDDIAKKTRGE